jgi:hypothetical protein
VPTHDFCGKQQADERREQQPREEFHHGYFFCRGAMSRAGTPTAV